VDPLRARLAEIVGEGHLVDAPATAAVDGVQPRWIVRPGDVEQVSRTLVVAQTAGLAVIPRGSGAALGLGRPPARADLILDLTRLNRVVEYEPADVVVTIEAGATLEEVGRVLAKHGQLLPLDPPGWRSRTLGGVLAANASGPLRAGYGTGRDLLLGARFVQADGSLTRGGSRVVKSVTGYDVPKLLVGSLGTLGVIVETTLRLHPVAEVDRTWISTFDALEGARDFLAALLDSTLQPARVEILDAAALAAAGHPDGAIGVAVSFLSVEEAVRAQGQALARLAGQGGGRARRARDDLWDAHDTALARPGRAGVRLALGCLAARVVDAIAAVQGCARAVAAPVTVSGCAATGSLRVDLEGERDVDSWRGGVIEPLRERLAVEGGSVVIARGPLALKRAVDVWGDIDPQALAVMERLKREFDPHGILNPGRFVGRL
jgi:glycolate oxidase FAD binding subunit